MPSSEGGRREPDSIRPGIPDAAVRAAVERVVASPDFDAPDRVKTFLRYIVGETLDGRANRIKAYSVATEAFGRDSSFDPRDDPLVRIEAGRLRRALEHYYLTSGKDDPVLIDVPKGGYVPVFTPRPPDSHEASTVAAADPPPVPQRRLRARVMAGVAAGVILVAAVWLATLFLNPGGTISPEPRRPSVLVLPFSDPGGHEVAEIFSAALVDQIISDLARFKEITVFGAQTALANSDADLSEIRQTVGADYVVEGSVGGYGDTLHVNARLIDSETSEVLWTTDKNYRLESTGLNAAQQELAASIATSIAQPYGIVFRKEVADSLVHPPDDLDAYLCTLRYYTYRADPSADRHAEVRLCLQRVAEEYPRYANAKALLALVYVDEIRAGFNPAPDAIRTAIEVAREAVRLEPENTRSLQALSAALFFGGFLSESLDVGRKALALNPNDTELLGQVGQQLGLSGNVTEGRALLELALARNPGHSDFYRGVLAMMEYLAEDYEAALVEIDKVDLQDLPIFHGVAAVIYARNGEMDKAKKMAGRLDEMLPGFFPNLWSELDKRNIPMEAQLRIADDLREIGLVVPPRPDGEPAA